MSYRGEDTRALRSLLTLTPYVQKSAEARAQLEPEMSRKALMVSWVAEERAHWLRSDAVPCRTGTAASPWPTIARRGARSQQHCCFHSSLQQR